MQAPAAARCDFYGVGIVQAVRELPEITLFQTNTSRKKLPTKIANVAGSILHRSSFSRDKGSNPTAKESYPNSQSNALGHRNPKKCSRSQVRVRTGRVFLGNVLKTAFLRQGARPTARPTARVQNDIFMTDRTAQCTALVRPSARPSYAQVHGPRHGPRTPQCTALFCRIKSLGVLRASKRLAIVATGVLTVREHAKQQQVSWETSVWSQTATAYAYERDHGVKHH